MFTYMFLFEELVELPGPLVTSRVTLCGTAKSPHSCCRLTFPPAICKRQASPRPGRCESFSAALGSVRQGVFLALALPSAAWLPVQLLLGGRAALSPLCSGPSSCEGSLCLNTRSAGPPFPCPAASPMATLAQALDGGGVLPVLSSAACVFGSCLSRFILFLLRRHKSRFKMFSTCSSSHWGLQLGSSLAPSGGLSLQAPVAAGLCGGTAGTQSTQRLRAWDCGVLRACTAGGRAAGSGVL